MQKFISLSAFGLGSTFFIFWWNFFYSMFYGEKAVDNPWRANTLEWTLPSPVTLHGNFPETPHVYHGPYEYSDPRHGRRLPAPDGAAQAGSRRCPRTKRECKMQNAECRSQREKTDASLTF